jgi:hypothetical protein
MLSHVFIVPYRNREQHRHFFQIYIKYLLEDWDPSTYLVLYAHQANDLPFNRGGVKNCAFLWLKHTYPETYMNLTLVFNDIDALPYRKNLLDYTLKPNEVKHYYGFNYALGGIFAIRASDFEKIDGFPSPWSWGWEDTVLHQRALAANLTINRDQFYTYADHNILHFVDDVKKKLSMRTYRAYKQGTLRDGVSHMRDVNFELNQVDPSMLDIRSFTSPHDPNDASVVERTLQTPATYQQNAQRLEKRMSMLMHR